MYYRDDFTCVWCGKRPGIEDLTLDHLFQRWSRHRDNAPKRLVTSCHACNTARGVQSVARWLRKLKIRGADMEQVYRRLQIARYLPPNRTKGAEIHATWRARPAPGPPSEAEIPF